MLLAQDHDLVQVPKRASKPIQLIYNEGLDISLLEFLKDFLDSGALEALGARALIPVNLIDFKIMQRRIPVDLLFLVAERQSTLGLILCRDANIPYNLQYDSSIWSGIST
jgi:hypothetical protein